MKDFFLFHFGIDINQPENHKLWVKNQILGADTKKTK